jgi:UTP-glucose-1-phosphate uridylyltransferase
MMQPTLLILAAGMASRYGSMKQTEGFGPNGETIMDYSIFDAIRAGFGKVVFIIRQDFAESFKDRFGSKLEDRIKVEYAFQEMNKYVNDMDTSHRLKPWGTGHAILCAAENIQEPFAVINADDYYGPDAFKKAAEFLTNICDANNNAIIGYQLNKTLSDHGTVSRGVCQVDHQGHLISIQERTNIYQKENKVVYEENGTAVEVDGNSSVSMNFWCFDPSIFELSEKLFTDFVKSRGNDPKSEFFIPIIADFFIRENGNAIKVIPTVSDWFGVTYKEDAPYVKNCIEKLISDKVYPETLWENKTVVS